MSQHSPNFYHDTPMEALGERPDESLLRNGYDNRDIPFRTEHDYKLIALREFEDSLCVETQSGRMTALEAEEAYWAFIEYVQTPTWNQENA